MSLDGFSESGADWLERFKPYIEDGKTVVVSPHRVFGPQTNDLVLQLRKRRISKVILGGMLANMCVESHLRDLLEQGFEVAVAKDATAAPRHPEWGDGYTAALINFAFLAHAVSVDGRSREGDGAQSVVRGDLRKTRSGWSALHRIIRLFKYGKEMEKCRTSQRTTLFWFLGAGKQVSHLAWTMARRAIALRWSSGTVWRARARTSPACRART